MKKRPPYNQNAAIRSAIRRTFSRSPIVREVMQKVRKEFPKYNKDGSRAKKDSVCYLCGVCKQYVGSTMVAVDHIIPVVSIDDGFVDWNTFVDRLFCDPKNLQVICDPCHNKKTNEEKFQRIYAIEIRELNDLTSGTGAPKETIKAWVKKFNKKRLAKYPYPPDFVTRVKRLRSSIGLKV